MIFHFLQDRQELLEMSGLENRSKTLLQESEANLTRLREELAAVTGTAEAPFYGRQTAEELVDKLSEYLAPAVCDIIKGEMEHTLSTTRNQVLSVYKEENREQIRELQAVLTPIHAAVETLYTGMKQKGAFAPGLREVEVSP